MPGPYPGVLCRRGRRDNMKTSIKKLQERIADLDKANKDLMQMRSADTFAATGRVARTIAHEILIDTVDRGAYHVITVSCDCRGWQFDYICHHVGIALKAAGLGPFASQLEPAHDLEAVPA